MATIPAPVADLETNLAERVAFEDGWKLIEHFSGLVRESGSPDELEAGDYIASELSRLGVEHEVFEPELYLSLPRESWVQVGESRLLAKPPAFSASTGTDGLAAEVLYVPSSTVRGQGDLFTRHVADESIDVRGRIVLTEGYAMPAAVEGFEAAGAVGQIYINPGENVHWGICTSIWGTPTVSNLSRKPGTPVVAISQPDGETLAEQAREGGLDVRVISQLEEGWYRCKLPVATIRGVSDEFALVHGHYDSWDVGIGDNAVGDATLLELARIFHEGRDALRRTLKIAWWPAHSTGRYGGSTWFADNFAIELRKLCVAAINIDSPGCWGATEYDDVMWMAEAEGLCRDAIRDATGKEAAHRRPLRAGDYSFNQVGLTSFFMLLSNIPAEEREALGFYPTGGCGGNIAWHTEDDTMGVADRDNLQRDLSVYVTALCRVLNAGVLPFDFRATLDELHGFLDAYQEMAGELLDLSPAIEEAEALRVELEVLYKRIDRAHVSTQHRVEHAHGRDYLNRVQVELARILVPLGYAEGERFDHDPALPRAPIPKLAGVNRLRAVADERPDLLPFLQNELRRQVNKVAGALFDAAELVRRTC